MSANALLDCIISDCMETFQYIPMALITAISVYVLLIIFRLLFLHDSFRDCFRIRDILLTLLTFVLMMIIQIALLSREEGSRTDVSLIIGGTWTEDPQGRAYVIENVLLFIPFGIIVWALLYNCRIYGGKSLLKISIVNIILTMLTGAITSLCIELIQRFTERGYFQVDDIIANSFGSLVGGFLIGIIWMLVLFIVARFRDSDH